MTEHESEVNRRILIIDDNQAIHEDFRKILGGGSWNDGLAEAEKILFGDVQDAPVSEGYEVECADQGQIGFALVQKAIRKQRPFAMAFVDMRMPPGWDGIETIEYLWKADPDLQMVICTAYSDHQWDQVMQRLGHSEKLLILRKPFDMVEVRQLADSLTAKWNLAYRAKRQLGSLCQTENALRTVLAETESLIAAISSVLIALDQHNCVIRWNAAAEQTFGVSSSIILGHSIESMDIQWDGDTLVRAVQDCRKQQQPIQISDLRYFDHSCTEHFLRMTLSPIHSETEACPGILLLGQDRTPLKSVEALPVMTQTVESMS